VSQKPILRVTYRRDDTTYSVLSVWPGKFPGTYSVSRDKGSEKYPAISIIDVLKAWAAGTGFVNVSVESEREQRGSSSQRGSDYSDAKDPMGDSEIPF
jgi:hypothetical protein